MAREERHIKTRFKKFQELPLSKKILSVLGLLVVVGIVAGTATMGYTVYKIGKINQDTMYSNIERSSILYDIDGEEIDTLHYTEDRTIVPIEDMPDNLKNAFIAVEDKTFYKHHGFNFRRMFGAVLSKLTGRSSSISGTSTITQQLARNAFLSEIKSQRSIRRKLSEMYIAWRLESKLSKDEILEAYLNTIYLGYGNYGVNSAARTYFSKEVGELDLAECAALAALPQAPDAYALITTEAEEGAEEITNVHYYSYDSVNDDEDEEDGNSFTYTDEETEEDEDGDGEADTKFYANDVSKERRDLVLDLMANQGYISDSDASDTYVDVIDILEPSFEKSESAYTYFKDYLADVVAKDLMEKFKMSEEEAQRTVYTGGLKIHTTIDSKIQNAVYDEFQDDSNFPDAADGSKVQASMVVTEVGTGHISAMVGGRDAKGSKLFNRAVSPRQPGSSIKPLAVYGAALQKSYEYAKKNQTFPFVDYGFDKQGTKYWGDYITASSGVIDEPLKINGEIWPQNANRSFSGSNSFRSALQKSINTCAVKIVWQVGLEYSAEMLEKYKLSTIVTDQNEKTNDVNPAALALGAMTYGVTPLDMALAYSVFPNGGVLNTPVCYTNVSDSEDNLMLVGKSEETEVLDKGVAWIMTDLLKSVVSNGLGSPAAISGVQVGGKTGTTNDTFDVWFDGFTPNYSAALWIGTDLNVEMYGTSSQAAALWGKIMGQIPGVRDGVYSEMPSNVIKKGGEYYSLGTEKNPGNFSGGSDKKSNNDSNTEEKETEKKEEKQVKKKTQTKPSKTKKKEEAQDKPSKPEKKSDEGDSGGGSPSDSDGSDDQGGSDQGGGDQGGGDQGGGDQGGGDQGGGDQGDGNQGSGDSDENKP